MLSSTYNSILLKSSSKNRSILLNTLERMIFCYTILKLRVLIIYRLHNFKIKNINYLPILPMNKPILFLL